MGSFKALFNAIFVFNDFSRQISIYRCFSSLYEPCKPSQKDMFKKMNNRGIITIDMLIMTYDFRPWYAQNAVSKLFLMNNVCHHSASLMNLNTDPQDRFT